MNRISASRMTYLTIAAVVTAGDIMTGVRVVSPLLWLPPVALSLAAITGVCPLLIIYERLGFRKG